MRDYKGNTKFRCEDRWVNMSLEKTETHEVHLVDRRGAAGLKLFTEVGVKFRSR